MSGTTNTGNSSATAGEAGPFQRHRKFLLASVIAAGLFAGPAVLTAGFAGLVAPQPAQAQISIDRQQVGRAPLSFADIVEKVRPAVVSVKVTVGQPKGGQEQGERQGRAPNFPDLPDSHPFNEFFKRFFDDPRFGDNKRGPRQFRRGISQGSGFIISADGYAVTNNHVINEASKVEVTFDDGQSYQAKVIGADDKTDLALLKIDADKSFKYVELADDEVRVGDWVVAVGNPFGLGGSVTAGIVSARGRDIGSGPYDDFLQIDAAVNRGNSGGPAFSLDGKVVGVNTAIYSPSGGNVGVAFAIPAATVKSVIAQLKDSGVVTRGWLGVAIQSVTPDIAESIGLDKAQGAIVTQVTDASPAERAGLKTGDAILSINGNDIESARDLARKVAAVPPSSVVKVGVLRGGKKQTIDVTLGQVPNAKLASAPADEDQDRASVEALGMELASASEIQGAAIDGVVVLEVDPDSEAAEKGIRTGDVIVEVGGTKVSRPAEVEKGLKDAEQLSRKAVLLRVRSGETERFIALSLKKA